MTPRRVYGRGCSIDDYGGGFDTKEPLVSRLTGGVESCPGAAQHGSTGQHGSG